MTGDVYKKTVEETNGVVDNVLGPEPLVEMFNHNEQMRRSRSVESPAKEPRVEDKTVDTVNGPTINIEDGDYDFSAEPKDGVVSPDGAEKAQPEPQPDNESTRTESDGAQPEAAKSENKKGKGAQTPSASQSDESSDGKSGKGGKERSQQQQQRNFKLVDQDSKQFSASGEFTEEQLVQMYRQMQADRARTKQLFNHVTSPYSMHGSVGESAAMAAGAFMGFALGRTMYKVSRIGHLCQDWRLRREVLRQERGYHNQGSSNRFGSLLQGFSNAAGSFAKGFRRGTRKDIDMDMSAQPSQHRQEAPAQSAQPEQSQQTAEKVVVKAADEMPANEPTVEKAFG